jgi:hypothetical protein
MSYISPSPLLKRSLILDVVVTGAVALLQLEAASSLDTLLGLPAQLLTGTGVFLVAYILMLVAIARAKRVASALVLLVIAGNVAWAVGCAALAVSGTFALTPLGYGFIALQAACVITFGLLEYAGWRVSPTVAAARQMRATS